MVSVANAVDLVSSTTHPLVIDAWHGGEHCRAEFRHTDITEAVGRYSDLSTGLRAIVTMGSCAALASTVASDFARLRSEMRSDLDHVSAAVEGYQAAVQATVEDGGQIQTAIRGALQESLRELSEIVTRQGDSANPQSLLARLMLVPTRIDAIIEARNREATNNLILAQQRQAEAYSSAARVLGNLDEASVLGQRLTRIEKGLTDLGTSIATRNAVAAERLRGNRKGSDYESAVAETVAEIALAHLDTCERTGQAPGNLVIQRRASNRGDITCAIGGTGGALRVVVEAMDRDPERLTCRAVVAELEEAMTNRSATVGIAVASLPCQATNGQPLAILGPNAYAVVLDRDSLDSDALRIVYALARQYAVSTSGERRPVDLAALREAVTDLSHRLEGLREIRTLITSVGTSQAKAMFALAKLEKELAAGAESVLRIIAGVGVSV